MRLPKGQGLWSALWMLPTTRESKPEVDIFETVGEQPDTVQMHTHWSRTVRTGSSGHKWHGGDMTEGWHTFGLQWKPDSLTWYVDGDARWRVTDPEADPARGHVPASRTSRSAARFTKTPDARHAVPVVAPGRLHPRLGAAVSAPSPPDVEATQRRLYQVFAARRNSLLVARAARRPPDRRRGRGDAARPVAVGAPAALPRLARRRWPSSSGSRRCRPPTSTRSATTGCSPPCRSRSTSRSGS